MNSHETAHFLLDKRHKKRYDRIVPYAAYRMSPIFERGNFK